MLVQGSHIAAMQLFVDDLTVMDFSYLCPERGMVGESWIVDVVLHGELNEESMIQDFGKVKKSLKQLIDLHVDHKLLVPAEYTGTWLRHEDNSDSVECLFTMQNGDQYRLLCPDEAYAFIYADEVSMTSVAAYLKEVIATHLPDNVDQLQLHLRTEEIPTPFYHYTHGLKKHDGNCQRIAHGHRSRIGIQLNGKPCLDMQAYWANRWQDIYIATAEDEIPLARCRAVSALSNPDDTLAFAYESSQGYFELALPKHRCEVIEQDTTVECLAAFLFQQIKQMRPDQDCLVKAFEGVGKGAMVGD